MMKTLTAALFAGALATTAGAATLDFIAEAAGNERGLVNGTTLNFDGIDVTFNATDGGTAAFAYFDDLFAGRPAGLGVCAALDTDNECVVGGDDNLRAGEVLTLTFGETVTLSNISFNDEKHFALPAVSPGSSLQWAINGAALSTITFEDAIAATLTGVNSITFGHAGTDYYIGAATASPVPLPAGVLLMGTALGGLGLTRRKKKAA